VSVVGRRRSATFGAMRACGGRARPASAPSPAPHARQGCPARSAVPQRAIAGRRPSASRGDADTARKPNRRVPRGYSCGRAARPTTRSQLQFLPVPLGALGRRRGSFAPRDSQNRSSASVSSWHCGHCTPRHRGRSGRESPGEATRPSRLNDCCKTAMNQATFHVMCFGRVVALHAASIQRYCR